MLSMIAQMTQIGFQPGVLVSRSFHQFGAKAAAAMALPATPPSDEDGRYTQFAAALPGDEDEPHTGFCAALPTPGPG